MGKKKKKGKKKPQAPTMAKAAKATPGAKTATPLAKTVAQVDIASRSTASARSQVPTRPMTAPPANTTSLVEQLFTSGEQNPTHIWMAWLLNLFAAGAWGFAFYPYINRLMQGQASPGLKLLDTSIALVGAFLLLRVVTLLSDLKRSQS